ncbi:MAG: AraC family transcriptional regulator [Bacteroidales bacterium]
MMMKLTLKNTNNSDLERLMIRKEEKPCMDSSWHYHAQYELLYVSESTGIRFVGDNVSQFVPGELVLVGPYLPHLWRNDISYYNEEGTEMVKTIVIRFHKNFIGEGTFNNPEFSEISNLLEQSNYGVSFGMKTSKKLSKELLQIVDMTPAEKSIKLLDILCRLSLAEDKIVLSSTDMRQYTTDNSQRIDTVLKYISANYTSDISLKDVSDIACMTTNSFCRFFKKMTNKSFTEFLNEIRIRNAARLLVQEELSISEICEKVGYKSITNFYRQFVQIMNVTPKGYRQTL